MKLKSKRTSQDALNVALPALKRMCPVALAMVIMDADKALKAMNSDALFQICGKTVQ